MVLSNLFAKGRVGSFAESARRVTEANDRSGARSLLARRPVPSDLSLLAAPDVIPTADLLTVAGDTAGAKRLYEHAVQQNPEFYWPYFQLGRIAGDSDDLEVAANHFNKSASLAPHLVWNWYELATVRLRQNDTKGLDDAIGGLVASERVEFNAAHLQCLKDFANHLFERNHRQHAWQLYDILHQHGVRETLIEVRRGERLLAEHNYHGAIEILEGITEKTWARDWGQRSLALAYIALERFDDAVTVLSEIVARNPANLVFLRDYVMLLAQRGETQAALSALRDAAPHHNQEARDELKVAVLAYSERWEELLGVLDAGGVAASPQLASHLMHGIVRTAYHDKQYKTARALIEHYALRFGEPDALTLCRLNVAFAVQDWDEAERRLGGLTEEKFQSNLELRVKRFEFNCFTRNLDRAGELLHTLEPLHDISAEFLPAVLRFYAETNAWRKLYDLAMSRLNEGFDYSRSGYILFRAIRKTGSHLAALTEIERIEQWEKNVSLRKLRTIIMEDMVHNSFMLEDISQDPNAENSEALQSRLYFKTRVLREGNGQAKDYAIYYCSDSTYFCGTLVSLTSLVMNNRELMDDAALFVTVESDFVDTAKPLVEKLAAGLGVEISVTDSKDLRPRDLALQRNYGIFSGGGHSLSDAAYYRIFMAQFLAQKKVYKRALYVDSDTVILPGLERLFWIKSQQPLMARLEEDRPEIEVAIRAHGLQPRSYFNSGVLYFDLQSRELLSGLTKTAQVIAESPGKLLFQDQCALNLGFAGDFSALRQEFNYFVHPDTEGDVGNAIVVHFLDRPKPWDPAYPAAICRLWYSYWRKLSEHIGSQQALELYRAANRG